jgi:hypothetical protein
MHVQHMVYTIVALLRIDKGTSSMKKRESCQANCGDISQAGFAKRSRKKDNTFAHILMQKYAKLSEINAFEVFSVSFQ